MTSLPKAVALAAMLAVTAGQAQAQAQAPQSRPLDLSALRSPLADTYEQDRAMKDAGVVRTSIDRRLGRDDLTGSFGFLCGLQPRRDETAGAAYGYDPHGRFVGAKLSYAFR